MSIFEILSVVLAIGVGTAGGVMFGHWVADKLHGGNS